MLRNREIRLLSACVCIAGAVTCAVCFAFDARAGVACLIGFALCFAAYCVFTRRRYREIAKLSDAVRALAERGRSVKLSALESAEGELSILQSEIYKLAERLIEQSAVLTDEKRALKNVLSDISHQLKTPLTALSIMADLLEDEALESEKRAEFMRRLKEGLSRMEWMVLSLLKLARLDASAVAFKPESVSARALAEAAARPLELMLDLRDQRVVFEGGGAVLSCDRLWSAEAVTNVLKNASEHSPIGGEIRVSVGENPICAWIAVQGGGQGIDPADLPHIFKRFYRQKNAPEGGVGIGLSLSLSILRAQGGDIEVRNERGKPAEFVLKFYRM